MSRRYRTRDIDLIEATIRCTRQDPPAGLCAGAEGVGREHFRAGWDLDGVGHDYIDGWGNRAGHVSVQST